MKTRPPIVGNHLPIRHRAMMDEVENFSRDAPDRFMALDVGDRRIGVAITDRLGLTVQGRPTLRRTDPERDIGHIGRMVAEEEVTALVVGLPVHMDGTPSRQTEKTAAFIAELETRLSIPVVAWDERLTSNAAERDLKDMGFDWQKRKKHVDELAAILILEDYLVARDRGPVS